MNVAAVGALVSAVFAQANERGSTQQVRHLHAQPPHRPPPPYTRPSTFSRRTCSMPSDRRLSIRSIQGRTFRSIATSTADASWRSCGATGTATAGTTGTPLPLASPLRGGNPPFSPAMGPKDGAARGAHPTVAHRRGRREDTLQPVRHSSSSDARRPPPTPPSPRGRTRETEPTGEPASRRAPPQETPIYRFSVPTGRSSSRRPGGGARGSRGWELLQWGLGQRPPSTAPEGNPSPRSHAGMEGGGFAEQRKRHPPLTIFLTEAVALSGRRSGARTEYLHSPDSGTDRRC